jgi:hypothetical protein
VLLGSLPYLHDLSTGLNLTVVTDAVTPAENQTFTYDNAARLLTASGSYGSRTWTYDKVGNRLTEAKTVSGTTTTQTYFYPANSNVLSNIQQAGVTVRSFLHSASGHMVQDTRGSTVYGYTDRRGRPDQPGQGQRHGHRQLRLRRPQAAGQPADAEHDAGRHHARHPRQARPHHRRGGRHRHRHPRIRLAGRPPVAVLDGSATPTTCAGGSRRFGVGKVPPRPRHDKAAPEGGLRELRRADLVAGPGFEPGTFRL